MRYQIENGNVPKVLLSDEINFIRNYIDLERKESVKDVIYVLYAIIRQMK